MPCTRGTASAGRDGNAGPALGGVPAGVGRSRVGALATVIRNGAVGESVCWRLSIRLAVSAGVHSRGGVVLRVCLCRIPAGIRDCIRLARAIKDGVQ